ncbi:MAG: Rid family detoxifying hydrolase [Deltaproteobacteria bacterium]|nr:Rid family detoxifying hydrolase [Deltaproteobacteria bacterium]MCL5277953.1 Rid family detoxifying hydrolase [Deltaproteobacteria bacterium]
MRHGIVSHKLPAPVGPYSQMVECRGFLFLSGQIALEPSTGVVVKGGIALQTEAILGSVKDALEEQGLDMGHIVKVTAYLVDTGDFGAFNGVYASYFDDTPPARTTVFVSALPNGARVELDIIAHP